MKHVITLSSIILAITASALPARGDCVTGRGCGFLMLEDPASPRNVSMGSVGTALGGAGIRYYNPAMPFFTGTPYVTAEFGMLPGEVTRGGFETAVLFGDFFSAMSFYSSSVGYETRDERGFGAPASSASTIGAASVGFIRGSMSAAVGITMAEDRIWVESDYTALALSGGLGCKMLDGRLSLGAAGFHGVAWSRGFGGDTLAASQWSDGRVPRFARGGAAWSGAVKSIPYTVAADVVYQDEDRSYTFPVGVEVKVLPILGVRAGKRIGWEDEIMSFGIGLNIDRLSFDAAFTPTVFVDDYEMKWSMSFTYNLGRSRKPIKFPPVKVTPDSLGIPETSERADEKEAADDDKEKSGADTINDDVTPENDDAVDKRASDYDNTNDDLTPEDVIKANSDNGGGTDSITPNESTENPAEETMPDDTEETKEVD